MQKRYSEERIIRTIKQHEAGAKADSLCRELGISNGTLYNWRSKYARLEVNEAQRLREHRRGDLPNKSANGNRLADYSHSIVAGGLLETS